MRIIIETQERHRTLFMEMAKALKAKVQIEPEEKKQTKAAFLDKLERSYREAQLHAEGKIELPTLKEFLNEL